MLLMTQSRCHADVHAKTLTRMKSFWLMMQPGVGGRQLFGSQNQSQVSVFLFKIQSVYIMTRYNLVLFLILLIYCNYMYNDPYLRALIWQPHVGVQLKKGLMTEKPGPRGGPVTWHPCPLPMSTRRWGGGGGFGSSFIINNAETSRFSSQNHAVSHHRLSTLSFCARPRRRLS